MTFWKKWFEPKGLEAAIQIVERRLDEGQRQFIFLLMDRERYRGQPLPEDPALNFYVAASSLSLRDGTEVEPIRLRALAQRVRDLLMCFHAGLWPQDGTRDLMVALFPAQEGMIRGAKASIQTIAHKFWLEVMGPPRAAPYTGHQRKRNANGLKKRAFSSLNPSVI